MTNHLNSSINNVLASIAQNAPKHVVSAIHKASDKTGVDFAYLVQQAKAESSFNPSAKAKTSSASGLYQFIESTWMPMVNKHGAKHGIETEGKTRGEILEMRKNPEKASLMAAELASENKKYLTTHHKGEIGATELYFAHFLGAGKAAAFLNARAENPMREAVLLFPKAAKANQSVFYDGNGRAKSLDEVYAFFDKKFEIETPAGTQRQEPKIQIAEASPRERYDSVIRKASLYNQSHSFFAQYQPVRSPVEIMLLAQLDLPYDRSQ